MAEKKKVSKKKATKTEERKSLKKTLQGSLERFSSEKSAKVRVESKYQHPKYGKIVKHHKSYLVHVPEELEGKLEVGQEVIIEEGIPVSKAKSWRIKNIVK